MQVESLFSIEEAPVLYFESHLSVEGTKVIISFGDRLCYTVSQYDKLMSIKTTPREQYTMLIVSEIILGQINHYNFCLLLSSLDSIIE